MRSQRDLVGRVALVEFLDFFLIFDANYYTFNIGICVKLNLIAANDAQHTPFSLSALYDGPTAAINCQGVECPNRISQLTKLINCSRGASERERVNECELFCCHKNFPCAAMHSRMQALSCGCHKTRERESASVRAREGRISPANYNTHTDTA